LKPESIKGVIVTGDLGVVYMIIRSGNNSFQGINQTFLLNQNENAALLCGIAQLTNSATQRWQNGIS